LAFFKHRAKLQSVDDGTDFPVVGKGFTANLGANALGSHLAQVRDFIAHPNQRKLAAANVIDGVEVWRRSCRLSLQSEVTRRCVAPEGCPGILSLSRRPGKLAAVGSLPASSAAVVAERFIPAQPTGRYLVGANDCALRAMDSTPSCFASLPQGTFRRQNPRWKPYALTRSYGFVRGVPSDRYPYRDSQISQYKQRALLVDSEFATHAARCGSPVSLLRFDSRGCLRTGRTRPCSPTL
jgi:hypothetical protein